MQTSLCAAGNSICRRSRCPPTRGHRAGQAVLPHLRRIVPARGSLRGVARPSLAYCCVALFATRGAVVVPLQCARSVLVLMFTARAAVRTMDAALGDAAAPTDNPSSGPASRWSQMAHVACGPQSWIPLVVGARRLPGDSRVLRRGSVCGWRGQRALLLVRQPWRRLQGPRIEVLENYEQVRSERPGETQLADRHVEGMTKKSEEVHSR
jgi:hypothetical protein